MSLMDHALSIFGAGGGLSPADIKPGLTVTKVQWDGCMATTRKEVDVGEVLRHAASPHDNGRYPGALVKWDEAGERWESFDDFRQVDRNLEVWR